MMRLRFLLFLLLFFAGSNGLKADLIIELTQFGVDGVQISWSGTGQLTAAIDETLDLGNFSGNPFSAAGTFSLNDENDNANLADGQLSLNFGVSEEFQLTPLLYDTLEVSDVGNGTTDIAFDEILGGVFGPGIPNSSFFTFIPPVDPITVTGLRFADLTPGTFTSTGLDSAALGTVTLNITASATAAVPEPGTLGMCSVIVMGTTLLRRRHKTKNRAAE